tara:strand:+ start:8413 stop:9189 length:777 start_codon:yes stop_codon:yes gene_type:complete
MMLFLSIVLWSGFAFLKTSRLSSHFKRNICNFIGMWMWFAGLSALPIAAAVSLHFTIPLMVIVLAIIFLGERPGPSRLIPTFIGFVGIIVILRPGTLPINNSALLVLGSALSYGAVAIYTRSLGATEHPNTTTFYYQMMVCAFSALSMSIGWLIAMYLPDETLQVLNFRWIIPNTADIPALLLLAISGTLAPYCLVRALVHAEATIIEPIEYLRLPISAGIAWLIFDQATDVWTWVGATIIAGSTLYMTRSEAKMAKS